MSDSENTLPINGESLSIHTHLGMLQNIIKRMASNSSASKAWCITLVSAVLVIVADKGKPDYAFIALLPTFIFATLDAYYLALEKAFRNSYNDFVSKFQKKTLMEKDLFVIAPTGNMSQMQIESLKSFSVWGFYTTLAILIVITKHVALN